MIRLRWIIVLCGGLALWACTTNPAERNNAGNSLYDQGDYNAAWNAYQAAQVSAPDAPEAYYNAASSHSFRIANNQTVSIDSTGLKLNASCTCQS